MKFKIVRWREIILKFKRLSATLYFLLQLSLAACLLQLLFQISRDFLHLTSGLSCFPKSGPNGSISRADIPRTDINPRNMSFQCWKVLSTVNLCVVVRSSNTDLNLTFSSAKQAGSEISFWFWLSSMQIGSGSDFFTCKLFWLSNALTQILYNNSEFYKRIRQV